MNVVRVVVDVASVVVFAALYVTGVFWAAMKARLAFHEWQERRLERRLTLLEAEAITEVAARVRESSPPLTPEWLAECVSNACEKTKGMGL